MFCYEANAHMKHWKITYFSKTWPETLTMKIVSHWTPDMSSLLTSINFFWDIFSLFQKVVATIEQAPFCFCSILVREVIFTEFNFAVLGVNHEKTNSIFSLSELFYFNMSLKSIEKILHKTIVIYCSIQVCSCVHCSTSQSSFKLSSNKFRDWNSPHKA